MKKIFRYSYLALMAILTIAFNACTDEYEYDAEQNPSSAGAYILASKTSLVFAEGEAQSLSFIVARHDTVEAASYKLYCTDETVASKIPSEVSFAAGEKAKSFTVDFDLPSGTMNKSFQIGVSDESAYMYGAHSQTYTVSVLKLIKGAQFASGLFKAGEDYKWDVDVYEYGTDANNNKRYLIRNPFNIAEEAGLGHGMGYDVVFTLNAKGEANTDKQAAFDYDAGDVVSGDTYASGSGTYNASTNTVLFLWTLSIGNTGYGFGTVQHWLTFPEGYDPLPKE